MEKGIYEVWHVKVEILKRLRDAERAVAVRLGFPSDYEFVARVKARSLEEVFRKTCDIGDPWWRNRGVECLKESRSTNLGDVVVSPSQKIYQVVSWGWMLVHNPALGQALDEARAQAVENATRARDRKPAAEEVQVLEERPKRLH